MYMKLKHKGFCASALIARTPIPPHCCTALQQTLYDTLFPTTTYLPTQGIEGPLGPEGPPGRQGTPGKQVRSYYPLPGCVFTRHLLYCNRDSWESLEITVRRERKETLGPLDQRWVWQDVHATSAAPEQSLVGMNLISSKPQVLRSTLPL